MALFNRRKKNTDVLPEEVREYYQSERRERAGVAWVLAIGTLLLTFLIAAGLFFGGRWVYRTVFNNDDKKPTASQDENESLRIDDKGNVVGGNNQSSNNNGNQSTGTSSTSTSTPSAPAGSNNTPAPAPSSTPTTTPNTGPDSLVNTGPGDE